jgi:hypothetical protein
MKEIQLLYANGIRKYYMITSELNPDGNTFILDLANSIAAFNLKLEQDSRITWFGANYLINFTVHEFKQLYDSGFTGGWFDITALDDENARRMRTPYRNHNVIKRLKDYAQVKRALDNSDQVREEVDRGVFWTMFMGNPAVTTEVIRKTLAIANREGISNLFDSCGLFTHLRVFDYEVPDEETLAVTYSIDHNLRRKKYNQLLPSFAYPPALLKQFSEMDIRDLYAYLGQTFLSTKYKETRDWHEFFEELADFDSISMWLSELSKMDKSLNLNTFNIEADNLNNFLGGNDDQGQVDNWEYRNTQIEELTNILIAYSLENYPEYFERRGLPSDFESLTWSSPYDIAISIYSKWGDEEMILEEKLSQARSIFPKWVQDLLHFCVQAILYKFNLVIKDSYKPFFV